MGQTELTPGTVLGPYVIDEMVAVGGFATVYRGHHQELGHPVAVKVPRGAMLADPEHVRRLLEEAQAYRRLVHPRIVAFEAIEKLASQPVLVTEWVPGSTLEERLQQGPLPVREALAVAMQIAEGLAAAHSLGLAHRDLKPANVMLASSSGVKLLDFGLVKPVGAHALLKRSWATIEGTVVGTPEYMSPEQVRGEEPSLPSDVFSFGAVLMEMLTGRSPFRRETAAECLHAVAAGKLPAFPRRLGRAARALHRVAARCLKADAALRFSDALELLVALRAIAEPWRGMGERLRAAALGACALVVLAVPVAIWVGWPTVVRQPLGGVVRLSHDGAVNPAVSPDGSMVAYVVSHTTGDSTLRNRGLTEDMALGEILWERPVVVNQWAGGKPRFSPDGRWVAFDQPVGPAGADIWAVPAGRHGSAEPRRLTAFPVTASLLGWFDWSANNALVVALARPKGKLLLIRSAGAWIERALL